MPPFFRCSITWRKFSIIIFLNANGIGGGEVEKILFTIYLPTNSIHFSTLTLILVNHLNSSLLSMPSNYEFNCCCCCWRWIDENTSKGKGKREQEAIQKSWSWNQLILNSTSRRCACVCTSLNQLIFVCSTFIHPWTSQLQSIRLLQIIIAFPCMQLTPLFIHFLSRELMRVLHSLKCTFRVILVNVLGICQANNFWRFNVFSHMMQQCIDIYP